MKPAYSIIIPVKNEPSNVIDFLMEKIKKSCSMPHEIIICRENGFGNAIMQGIKKAKTRIVVPVMSDACDDLNDLETLVNLVKTGCVDVACASRYTVNGFSNESNLFKKYLSIFVNKLCQLVYNIPVTDTTNSFKAYKKIIFESFTVEAKHFNVSMEITLKAFKQGYRLVEIPTLWNTRLQGYSKFNILKMSKEYYRTFKKNLG